MLRRALTRSPLLVAFIGLWACDDNTVTSSAGTSTNASGGATSSTSSTGAGGAGGAFVCTEDIPPDLDAPELLSETGLFNDIAQRTLAPCVQLFEPRYHLWSDGAVKD
ncbi:MAG TPA: hypothetical protein VFB62_23365, partial [Polyangiaceae bacterium]|nr:hypothetical protein [Polyangiaceae bacterium]